LPANNRDVRIHRKLRFRLERCIVDRPERYDQRPTISSIPKPSDSILWPWELRPIKAELFTSPTHHPSVEDLVRASPDSTIGAIYDFDDHNQEQGRAQRRAMR